MPELVTQCTAFDTSSGQIGRCSSPFVWVNTVKTHLRGIYRKLGVRHRRDAISVARERGLL
ncbi:hypothetical protein DMH04_03945 [Kibdelosporangium aridum]|uniref:HTH luxR-type domain-containing protein n=1 Tax=Kibdelosporangium aridum TaxID=2030 RepID=A0A428ZRL4_KIBAR|nr:LuxR C-terminal-related transcriptional regulator [Kibdelosporangium aridum]RSM90623.1 hypothetical protein DMH04_03945 [Kibdelosporangium aridum]